MGQVIHKTFRPSSFFHPPPLLCVNKLSGPLSKLEHPTGLDADVAAQMKRPELVSSQAQSLTKKYQETKELLQLQELKKRNMQAQLGLSLSHTSTEEPSLSEPPKTPSPEIPPPDLVQKTVSFVIHDSADRILKIEELTAGQPLTLSVLVTILRSLEGVSQEVDRQGSCQKLLDTWKHQQEAENETIKKSLAKAGESIRNYESRLLTMEDMLGRVHKQKVESLKNPYGPLCKIEDHPEMHEITIGTLSQRVELLTCQNAALTQRYQEMLNQLTEADREIDRLKAELSALQEGKRHLLLVEELNRVKEQLAESEASAIDREYYERELNEKSHRLHEALVTLEMLGDSLKDTERRLQLKEATLRGLGFHMEDGRADPSQLEGERLREQLAATEAKLAETDELLQSTEGRCRVLQAQNAEIGRASCRERV